MYWYVGMLEMHRWLAVASVLVFTLRALGVLLRLGWLTDGRAKIAQIGLDVPLTISGLSLWGLLQINPVAEPWLGLKFLLLGAYIACGAWAMRAKEREAELLGLLLALLCMGALFGVALTRDPFMGLR